MICPAPFAEASGPAPVPEGYVGFNTRYFYQIASRPDGRPNGEPWALR
jgi:hypothetical protein